MKLEYSPMYNLHKQKLVAFVIIFFMIDESKNYSINNSNTGNIGIE